MFENNTTVNTLDQSEVAIAQQLHELADLQLALIGGGVAVVCLE